MIPFILVIFLIVGQTVYAQIQTDKNSSIDFMDNSVFEVMNEIENNNLGLQTARHEMQAMVLDSKSENNLSDPKISYASLYNSKRSGESQGELTIVQEFDFPTAYIKRNQYNKQITDSEAIRYSIIRREVLLEAQLLCIQIIGLNRESDLLKMLIKHADTLINRCNIRLQAGDANILEVNRTRLELMGLRTELANNEAEHRTALQRLIAMNGNKPLSINSCIYPQISSLPSYEVLCDEILPLNGELQQAKSNQKSAAIQIAVKQMECLPKLEIGYRRNTSPTEQFNGFIIGGSIPIFSNTNKIKAARARLHGAEARNEELFIQVESELQSLYNEARQLEYAMNAYDLPLMDENFVLLNSALNGGELSWHQYFTELEVLVRRKLSFLQIECRYHQLMARIYADKL